MLPQSRLRMMEPPYPSQITSNIKPSEDEEPMDSEDSDVELEEVLAKLSALEDLVAGLAESQVALQARISAVEATLQQAPVSMPCPVKRKRTVSSRDPTSPSQLCKEEMKLDLSSSVIENTSDQSLAVSPSKIAGST